MDESNSSIICCYPGSGVSDVEISSSFSVPSSDGSSSFICACPLLIVSSFTSTNGDDGYSSTTANKRIFLADQDRGNIQGKLTLTFRQICPYFIQYYHILMPYISFTSAIDGKLGYLIQSRKGHIILHLYRTNAQIELLADFTYIEMPYCRYVSTYEGKLGYLNHFREQNMSHYYACIPY